MSTVKRCISLLLVMVILMGVFSPAAQAASSEETASVNTDNVTIEGTNGFSNLLSQEITKNKEKSEAAEAEYPSGYTVTDLEIEGNTATVTYDAMEDATLVVALYTEDGMQMVTSTTATVTPDATEATLTFEGEMPEFFLTSAYLLDQYDYSPLCASYDTPMYTREMQELLDSTVNDYDPAKVLNLDADETTNFAVYADSTIIIEAAEGANTVVSVDNDTATYIIEHADEQITSLVKGDVFAYFYGEHEILIVKVDTIAVDGSTAIIIGTELEMEEVFSHVKIEGDCDTSEAQVDTSVAHEGITYIGNSRNSNISTMNEGGTEFGKELAFTLDMTILGDDTTSINLSGNLNLGASVSVSYYITTSYQQVELQLGTVIGGNLTVSGKLGGTFSIAKLKFPIIAGMLEVGLEPGIVVEFEGALAIEYSHSASHWVMVSHGSDGFYSDYRYISEEPHIAAELEGCVFIGLSLAPLIDIASGMLVKLELELQAGFEATLAMRSDEAAHGIRHSCLECYSGNISFVAKVIPSLILLNWDRLEFSVEFSKAIKLCDIYRSSVVGGIRFGTCPYQEYRVTVHTKGEDGFSVGSVEISGNAVSWGRTNDYGTLDIYLPAGHYILAAEMNGGTTNAEIFISEPSKITITLGKGASVNTNPGEELKITEYWQSIDTDNIADDCRIIASGVCGEDAYWELNGNGLLRIFGTGAMSNYTLKNTPWYPLRSSIRSVIIESGVQTIGHAAFSNCSYLDSVVIGSSVTTIGEYAFGYCDSLVNLSIPDKVNIIDNYAFSNCHELAYVIIPDSVTTIGHGAFFNCSSLTSVNMPNNIAFIGNSTFYQCRSLTSMTLPESVTSIGVHAFGYCSRLTNIDIPGNTTLIDDYAFIGCISLEDMTIPKKVTSIGRYAFHGCDSLTGVTIPENVAYIGEYAFHDCDSLLWINVDSKNENYSSDAVGVLFDKEKNTLICAPGGITGLYSIPNSVTSVNNWAFSNCTSLTGVTIPESVISINGNAFYNCKLLMNVIFTGSAPAIGGDVFYGVSATAYYPDNNPSWISDVMQNYGGTIIWVPYTPDSANVLISNFVEIPRKKPDIEIEAVYGGMYDTEITEQATIKTASFSDLVPGAQYVMLAMMNIEVDDPIAVENLLGIDQGIAAEDGTLSFHYIQRTPADISYVIVCGASSKNIQDAVITFPEITEDGALQVINPTVTYGGTALTEGVDYVITGTVDYIEAGEYICCIRGILNYTGLIECAYTVAAHEHSFTTYISDGNATCTEDGTMTAKCDNCEISNTILDVGSALGHVIGEWVTVTTATCTENGKEKRDCLRCDYSENRSIEASGHSWDNGNVTREPTEDTEGELCYTCTICSEVKIESIPVIDHEHRYEIIVTEPTCTGMGYTTYSCACGHSYICEKVFFTGHSMSPWNIHLQANCTRYGEERSYCENCDYFDSRSIEMTGHSFADGICTTCGCDEATSSQIVDVTNYSYNVTPILTPFSYCLYVQTDNPDPRSFRLVDRESAYYEPDDVGTIRISTKVGYISTETEPGTYYISQSYYPDVVYEDRNIHRVSGGYIFLAHDAYSDGGELVLLQQTVVGSDILGDEFQDTDIIIPCQKLYTRIPYLIEHCTDPELDLFENLNQIDSFLSHYAIYPRAVYDVNKPNDSRQYPMLVSTYYPELPLYPRCTSMFEKLDDGLLMMAAYPFILDSLSYPGTIGAVAKVLAPDCTIDNTSLHYEVEITHNGNVAIYGGSGNGGLDPLYSNRVEHTYSSSADFATVGTLDSYQQILLNYTVIANEDNAQYMDFVMGDTFRATIRSSGSIWAQVADEGLLGYNTSFAYLMWDGHSVHPLKETWVDGRYVNVYEVFQLGAKFTDYPTADILLHDVTYTNSYGQTLTADVLYTYSEDWDEWRCSSAYTGGWVDTSIDLPDELSLTHEEVAALELDANSHKWPENGLIYDGTSPPGTPFTHISVTGINLSESITLRAGEEAILQLEILPANADNPQVEWYVSDESIVQVVDSDKRLIRGISEGSTQITVTTVDGGYSAVCQVIVKKSIDEILTFQDVSKDTFYYEPVLWAIENGITNGTSATTFSPNDQCMRAHVVTFLWRAVGSPEPTKMDNPFVDVKSTDFYYKPVLWAVENGITAGMDATHFGPTAYCNRAQVVTFLYRTVGSPSVNVSQNPFIDVPTGQWFTAPVLWAVENGITNGVSATTFGPNTICNRAQIVTFLYRAFA